MNERYEIREFSVVEATEAEFAALQAYENAMRAERTPEDPPKSVAAVQADWQSMPPFLRVRVWLVWDAAETAVIAQGLIATMNTDENQHMAQVGIGVLPGYRRQGIARRLLALLVAEAAAQNRRLLMGNTNGRVPAGERFMERLGGSRGLATHLNQLALADLDQSLRQSWLQNAPTAEFDLGWWEGPYPEEQLADIVALHEVMNQQPYDDLEVEDFHMTGEQLRQIEANLAAQGVTRWTLYVQEKATGQLAGYTEMMFLPERPAVASQGDTGVFPEYRGKGLGRWLKAAMLERVVAERPLVHFIRTGNADSNAAMLKINRELGFQPYLSQAIWQVETAQVKAYLGG
ncbi:MAG: GNAT family N-acetyltransferase [Anaerolineae bacterium]|nr:GNAT family N-acetyltransferase [Anaerolineae bacterium]